VLEVHPRQQRPDKHRDEIAGIEAERRSEHDQGMLVTPEEARAVPPDDGITVDRGPDGPEELEGWAEEDPGDPLTVVPDGLELDPGE
jgi:hypothetical protein